MTPQKQQSEREIQLTTSSSESADIIPTTPKIRQDNINITQQLIGPGPGPLEASSLSFSSREESGSFLNKPLTDVQRQQLIEAARTTQAVNHGKSKLCEDPYELKTGRPVEAARGLVNRMNVNMSEFYQLMSKETDGIIEEVTNFAKEFEDPAAKEVLELLQYILYEKTSEKEYPNGTRDKGRVGKDLIYFITHTKAQQAQLKQPEVVALRLYTTAAFRFMNGPLRDDMRHEDGRACPLPVTTCFAVEGIKKLRAHNLKEGATADSQTFWRGMRNLRAAEKFMLEGGTEMAFMSTTTALEVAVRYSLSQQALLFKIVAPNFLAAGADVQWLSAFPQEKEILYPPLTYLKPTGRVEEVSVSMPNDQTVLFRVVEVTPTLA